MRTPDHVQPGTLAAGALALAAGASALGGWDTPLPADAAWPTTPLAAAIGLLGCGIAALCAGLGRARGAGIAAALLAASMAGLGLLGIAPGGIGGGAEVHRLQLNMAGGLLLSGVSLALLLARGRPVDRSTPVLWASGVVIACLGGAALLGTLWHFDHYYQGWGRLTGMSLPAAASLLGLGLAVIALTTRLRDFDETYFSWMGIGVGAAGALGALAVWAALAGDEQRQIERTVRHVVTSVRFYVALAMDERLDNLVRMADRWAVGREPLREEWEADAQLHVAQDPGLEALAWVDPAGVPRLFVAVPDGAVVASDVEGRVQADRLGQPRALQLSPSFALASGARAFAVYAPIWEDERYQGCIVAVMRADAALAPALQQTWEGYDVVLSDAGGDLLRLVHAEEPPRLAQESQLHLPGDAIWQVRAWPRPTWLARIQSDALEFALGIGMALAVLTGSLVSLAHTARQRLRSVQGFLESAPDAMVVVNGSGTIVLVNAETERLFGYRREEIVGRSVDRLVPERLLSQHRRGRQRYFAQPGESPEHLEVVGRRRDGSEFPVEISLRTIASERGPLVSSAIRDLTGRRDEELRRRLAAIVTSSNDAIVGARVDGTIVDWNPGAERNYGWSAQEAVGRPIDFLEPAERRGEMRAILEKVRSGERVEHVETVRQRKDGELISVSVSVSPIRDESGAVVGAASIGRDVSEIKRAREDLRLQRDALATANAELARSNADLDQFAAVVSHDLKAPLRGIASLAEWLAEDHGDAIGEEGCEQLAALQARAQRMYRLIDGILEYSRVGRSRQLAPVDTRAVILDVLDGLAPPASIEMQLGPDLPTVVYDEAQLTQVLQNLVDNAIRHLGRPAGVIRFDAREGTDEWTFRVADDGVGIAEEHRERIFRIFQTLSPERGSTGVGLAVVKKIVESNGGRVWVQAGEGGGSEFYFTVPKRGA